MNMQQQLISNGCLTYRSLLVSDSPQSQWPGLSNGYNGFPLPWGQFSCSTTWAFYKLLPFASFIKTKEDFNLALRMLSDKNKALQFSKKYMDPDWDNKYANAMEWLLYYKLFHYWDAFGQILMSTKNEIIYYMHPSKLWGKVQNKYTGLFEGKNLLGLLLMGVRHSIKQIEAKEVGLEKLIVKPPYADFHLFGVPIGNMHYSSQYQRPVFD